MKVKDSLSITNEAVVTFRRVQPNAAFPFQIRVFRLLHFQEFIRLDLISLFFFLTITTSIALVTLFASDSYRPYSTSTLLHSYSALSTLFFFAAIMLYLVTESLDEMLSKALIGR